MLENRKYIRMLTRKDAFAVNIHFSLWITQAKKGPIRNQSELLGKTLILHLAVRAAQHFAKAKCAWRVMVPAADVVTKIGVLLSRGMTHCTEFLTSIAHLLGIPNSLLFVFYTS